MAGKGGGAWKVAYADFVTAMMAFFLVMWIVAQNKPLKEAVAHHFRDPFGTAGSGAASKETQDAENAEAANPTQILQTQLDEALARLRGKDNTRLEEDDEKSAAFKAFLIKLHDGERTSVGAIVRFGEGSAELEKASQDRLRDVAPFLRGKPNKIEVRGHATMRPLTAGSPFKDSWELCYARCQATMRQLIENGVEPERIRLSQAGVYEPRTQATEPDAWARNGRVEVFLLGEHVEDLKGTNREREGRVVVTDPAK